MRQHTFRPVHAPDCDYDTLLHLTVEIVPAHRVRRWGWRLLDARDGDEVETGFDYASPSAARAAALSRLAELQSVDPLRWPQAA